MQKFTNNQVLALLVLILSVGVYMTLKLKDTTASADFPLALASGAFGYLSNQDTKENGEK